MTICQQCEGSGMIYTDRGDIPCPGCDADQVSNVRRAESADHDAAIQANEREACANIARKHAQQADKDADSYGRRVAMNIAEEIKRRT